MDAESNLRSDFRLIETMRFDGLAVPLLARHMARMRRSAQHFDFPFAAERMHATVQAAVVDLSPHRCWKVRLTLARDGMMRVETAPLPDIPPEGPRRLMLSSVRIDPDNVFRRHKTTRRDVYKRAQREAEAAGVDEAILMNTRGEVTETTWSTILVQVADRYLTPPVASGALPGVYRDHLLDTQETVEEAVLHPEDLHRADGLFCCNAVRGWRPAEWAESVSAPGASPEA